MSKERFDKFLTFLSNPEYQGTSLLGRHPDFEDILKQIGSGYVREIAPFALMIMKSRIFHNGGLSALQEGNILTRGKSNYSIKNLEKFVWDLATNLWLVMEKAGPKNMRRDIAQRFTCMFQDLDFLNASISVVAKRREIEKIRAKLEEWRKIFMIKLSLTDFTVFTGFTKQRIKNDFFKIFVRHLTDIPEDTISKRCAELLTGLGIATKKETIRKRLIRAKTKSPSQ